MVRAALLSTAFLLIAGSAAGAAPSAPAPQPPVAQPGPNKAIQVVRPHPQFTRCCRDKVWDRDGKEIGDLVGMVPLSAGTVPSTGIVAYHLAGGDAVLLQVAPESIVGYQGVSNMMALFTTPDCSGNDMYAAIGWPPLEKRHALVLLESSNASYLYIAATHAWLFVTDPLPARFTPPPGMLFHSAWSEQGNCAPIAAPGYTWAGGIPGYRMHRVEDLLAKFHRPFYVDY